MCRGCQRPLLRILVWLVILAFISWSIFYAITCVPDVPNDFTVGSLTLTGLNVSATSRQVSGHWTARFEVSNNPKITNVEYGRLRSSVFYKDQLLSLTLIPAFNVHGARNHTAVEAKYSTLKALVGQADAFVGHATVNALVADVARGSVGFDVRVNGTMRYKAWIWRRRRHHFEPFQVLCGVISVTVSNGGGSGNFDGAPRRCKVQIL